MADKNLIAVVMAAGKGTRLRPLTFGVPKPLLPIKGKACIDWAVNNVMKANPDKIIITIPGFNVNSFEERILAQVQGICVDFYLKNAGYNKEIVTVPTMQRETAGDLKQVLQDMDIRTGKVIVAYGDVLTEINVKKLLDYHNKARKELGVSGTVVLFKVTPEESKRFGIAELETHGNTLLIKNFIEKPKTPLKENFANAGYYILEVEDIYADLPNEKIKVEESIFPKLAEQRKLAAFIEEIPYWLDIGTLEAYEKANSMAYHHLIMPPNDGVKTSVL